MPIAVFGYFTPADKLPGLENRGTYSFKSDELLMRGKILDPSHFRKKGHACLRPHSLNRLENPRIFNSRRLAEIDEKFCHFSSSFLQVQKSRDLPLEGHFFSGLTVTTELRQSDPKHPVTVRLRRLWF